MSSSAPLGTRSSTAIAAGQPVRSSSFMRGAWRVFELSLGEMLWSRRTVFLAIVVGCPVLVAAVIRIVDSLGVVPLRINGQRMDFTAIFGVMIWLLFLRFIVPVLGVFYGTALIADEVEDKTITYLFTRPIRRSAVLIGKYIAYLVCTTLVVLPGVVLVYFLIVPFQQVGASFGMLVTDLALLAIGLAAYGGLFALVGTIMKRPLIVGLVFAFGWEQFALIMPGYVRRFTLMYYVQSLVPHAMPSEGGVTSLLQAFFTETPSTLTCLFSLAVAIGVSLVLAGRAVEKREYVLEQ
jgi:ABC-type transport system involved in multi-copper enzyme maturation permease subunit